MYNAHIRVYGTNANCVAGASVKWPRNTTRLSTVNGLLMESAIATFRRAHGNPRWTIIKNAVAFYRIYDVINKIESAWCNLT